MSATSKKTKKKILPKAGKKRETLEQSLRRINAKYGETLAKLAK
ncbi:MAG TPA: hypothetical protein VM008_21775 [Phycisphaerae bacterium]|nr:hypothetical protein [Phycisphaerae bacterium]